MFLLLMFEFSLPCGESSTEQVIQAIETKFCINFTLLDIKLPTGCVQSVQKKTDAAAASVADLSIRRRSQQLGLCYSTIWKILRKNLCFQAYRIQDFKPGDLP